MTFQSEESITAAEASASQSSLFWNDIKNIYQFYIWEWELHDKWIKLNLKTYNIMQRHIKNNCKSILKIRTSFKTWQAIENIYWIITYIFIVEVYSKIHDQQSEIYKIKAAFTAVIQQMIYEYCKIADVNSSCCMRKEKSLILYQVFDSEFYHFKKQVKIMKKTNIDSKKWKIWLTII